eukprot:6194661-Pleurochrysis_carterae.AAC.1
MPTQRARSVAAEALTAASNASFKSLTPSALAGMHRSGGDASRLSHTSPAKSTQTRMADSICESAGSDSA